MGRHDFKGAEMLCLHLARFSKSRHEAGRLAGLLGRNCADEAARDQADTRLGCFSDRCGTYLR